MKSLEGAVRRSTPAVTQRYRGQNLVFVGWASAIFLVGSVTLLVLCARVTGGRVIYVLDDPAIHLSIAQTLLHNGTWGVQPGVYQSASSSPLWDLLLAAAMWVTRTRNILPWLLNVLAGLWLIWAIGSRQQVLRPRWTAPLSVLATGALVTVVLFMPSLTMVGMEDLLFSAMVVQLVAWMHDRAVGRPTRTPRWAPYVLVSLAVLTRFEAMWVAAGIGLGYLADGWVRHPRHRALLVTRLRTVAALGAATAAPAVAYGAFNRAMGQGLLPNSVLAKTPASDSPQVLINHLDSDRLVALLLIAAIVYLALVRPATRHAIVPAVTLVVAIVAHTLFAQYGAFERYQVYLVALGAYFALSVARDAMPGRPRAVAVITLVVLIVTPVRLNLLFLTPTASDNTYEQRYQAALFVQRYYPGRPIATSELGYISLLHRGPITDLLGLGDYEVLQHRDNGSANRAFFANLARRRKFPVAIVYPFILGNRTPATWFLVATWVLHERPVSTYNPLQFWATSPSAARQLRADLVRNAPRLPGHVTQVLNACLAAQLAHTETLLCRRR